MANKPTTHPAVGSSTVRPAKAPTAQKTMANTNRWSTRVLVTIALLCAISVLLSFVEFPLLPGVAWLSYDASIMPAAVCGFAFGPAAGLACGIISVVAHGILFADFTGALMNLLVVIGFILPSALVYKKIHTLRAPSSAFCSASCSPSSWPCSATSWSPRHGSACRWMPSWP